MKGPHSEESKKKIGASQRAARARGIRFKPKSCAHCGAVFAPRSNGQKFCSDDCGIVSRANRENETEEVAKRRDPQLCGRGGLFGANSP